MSWMNESGPLKDVVLSSRIRLARNLADYPFPSRMDREQGIQAAEAVCKGIQDSSPQINREFRLLWMKSLPLLKRQTLVEKHLASPDLMHRSETAALLLDEQERISIMLNEEDHIRMQCILSGFQLEQAWVVLNPIDDWIEARITYAYDETLGYLTGCPTNTGTGLRASIMMHLPALAVTQHINVILHTITKIGLTARGLYGEGSEALGCIYQISNQITLGLSEDEIIHNLTIAAQQIIAKERQARKTLLQVNGIGLEDGMWRAYGLLTHARRMDLKEFMALWSQLRLGVYLKRIPDVPTEALDPLMIGAQDGMLKTGAEDAEDLEVSRADFVRYALASANNRA